MKTTSKSSLVGKFTQTRNSQAQFNKAAADAARDKASVEKQRRAAADARYGKGLSL